jgi:hypothetical protein
MSHEGSGLRTVNWDDSWDGSEIDNSETPANADLKKLLRRYTPETSPLATDVSNEQWEAKYNWSGHSSSLSEGDGEIEHSSRECLSPQPAGPQRLTPAMVGDNTFAFPLRDVI